MLNCWKCRELMPKVKLFGDDSIVMDHDDSSIETAIQAKELSLCNNNVLIIILFVGDYNRMPVFGTIFDDFDHNSEIPVSFWPWCICTHVQKTVSYSFGFVSRNIHFSDLASATCLLSQWRDNRSLVDLIDYLLLLNSRRLLWRKIVITCTIVKQLLPFSF